MAVLARAALFLNSTSSIIASTSTTRILSSTITSMSSTAASTASSSAVPTQCADGSNPDASCFNALDLGNYITNWWNANEGDCGSFDGFADCWYSKMTPYSPSKCDQLNTNPACSQPYWKDFDGTTDASQNFYVTWCVWNTQGFFLDMYNAIGDASSTVEDNIGSIVTALDPPSDGTSPWEYVFDALTFGLSLYSEGNVLIKAFLRSLPQTSTLLHGLFFPPGDVAGDVTAWSDVAAQVGKFTSTWQQSVGSGLPIVQNNITAFIAMGQQIPISGVRPSLDGLTTSIAQSVGAYTISACIQELGWVVSRAEALDVSALQNSGQTLWWDTNCGGGYDSNGICDSYFYDGTDTYGLTDPNNMATDQDKIVQQLIGGTNPLTTGQLLFTSALQCTQTCGANGGCGPTLDPTDASVASCLSTLRVCTWTWDTYGPFQNGCANLPSDDAVLPAFGVNPCIGTDDGISVPHVYLGGGILKDNAPGWWADEYVCNSDY